MYKYTGVLFCMENFESVLGIDVCFDIIFSLIEEMERQLQENSIQVPGWAPRPPPLHVKSRLWLSLRLMKPRVTKLNVWAAL